MEYGNIYGTLSDTYTAPRTSYSQLMVTAHMAENENKKIWNKVRARATISTDSEEETTE